MLYKPSAAPRHGAHTVEAAMVYPVVILIILALIVGGLGIFRFNQIANLAREGARWASVHGITYSQELKNSSTAVTTGSDIYTNAIKPKLVDLDTTKLTVAITWGDPTGGSSTTATASDGTTITHNAAYQGMYVNNGTAIVQNTVQV